MHLPYRRGSSGEFAFTLIELMVVIALIGIMTAVILPEMKGTYEEALLRSTARKLVDAFSLANSHAISLHQPHRVRIDRKNGRYFIETTAREAGKERGFAAAPPIPGGEGAVDSRISIEIRQAAEGATDPGAPGTFSSPGGDSRNGKRDDTISFYADGTAEAQEIRLRDRAGFGLALRINPVTARVQIAELEPE